tara:strand:+ start:354 stop:488 length:135 start_codon:yes stop_codon:yes gene_type:complete
MNNLLWICVGIALATIFPSLTDHAQSIMSGLLEILNGVNNENEV